MDTVALDHARVPANHALQLLEGNSNCVDVIASQFILEKGWEYWHSYPHVSEYNFGNVGVTQPGAGITIESIGAGVVLYAYTLLIGNPSAYAGFVEALRAGNPEEAVNALAKSPWANPPYGSALIDLYDEIAHVTPPAREPRYVTVEYGMSLWGIATKYGTTVQALLKKNPQIKNPNIITVGEHVFL